MSFIQKQLTKHYPEILTPDNIWIIGITQIPSTRDYCLVFYSEIREVLDRFMRFYDDIKFMQYTDFDKIEEIGSGSCDTVYTARYNNSEGRINDGERVVLKRFKNFDHMPELFISEVSNFLIQLT